MKDRLRIHDARDAIWNILDSTNRKICSVYTFTFCERILVAKRPKSGTNENARETKSVGSHQFTRLLVTFSWAVLYDTQ